MDLQKIGLDGMLYKGIIDKSYHKELQQKTEQELRKWYGKIACSMSHARAMEQLLIDGDDKALIFEDDNQIPDETSVKIIHKRFKDILNELEQAGNWIFCNLSPCISDSNVQKSTNLYTGTLGYCMNAYLVTPEGVKFFRQAFPLTKDCHTLDNYLPNVGKKYPSKMFDVHPRMFSQKLGHSCTSELGNNVKEPIVKEYIHEEHMVTLTNIHKYLVVIIIMMLILLMISIFFQKKYFIIISAIGLIVSILVYYFINKQENYVIKNKLRDIKNSLPYLSTECSLFNKMSDYRLGDVFTGNGDKIDRVIQGLDIDEYHLKNFPDSIASQYIRKNVGYKNYKVMSEIIADHFTKISLPEKNEAVVHLRCGDVIELSKYSVEEILEKDILYNDGGSYTYPIKYYYDKFSKLVDKGITKLTIISGSPYYFDNFKKSCQYIYAIKILAELFGMQTKLRLGGNPDDDLTYMVSATHFIPGKGQYSMLIKKLREYQ